MPYKGIDDKSLPSYVKKLSKPVRARWIAIFNQYYQKSGESIAFKMANGWLKKNLSKTNKEVAAKTINNGSLEIYTLRFSLPEEELVIKTFGDEEYIEAVLTDIGLDEHGNDYDESFLYEIADQINREGIIGDFDHEYMKELRKQGLSPQEIANKLKGKKGIAKAVKALVRNGKLWIQAQIDKRYKKRIMNSRGLSIEGLFSRKEGTKTYHSGTVVGFTFAENDQPANPRAGVVA